MKLKEFFSNSGLIILYILIFIFVVVFLGIMLFAIRFTPFIFGFIPLIVFIVLLFIKTISFKKKLMYSFPVLIFFIIIILIPFKETNSGGNVDINYMEKQNIAFNKTCLIEYYGDKGFVYATSAVKDCGKCFGVLKNFMPGILDEESCVGFMKCVCYIPENNCDKRIYVPCDKVDAMYY